MTITLPSCAHGDTWIKSLERVGTWNLVIASETLNAETRCLYNNSIAQL